MVKTIFARNHINSSEKYEKFKFQPQVLLRLCIIGWPKIRGQRFSLQLLFRVDLYSVVLFSFATWLHSLPANLRRNLAQFTDNPLFQVQPETFKGFSVDSYIFSAYPLDADDDIADDSLMAP